MGSRGKQREDVFMCGVIKEKCVQWEPHSQSGPWIPERRSCGIDLPAGACETGNDWPVPGKGTHSERAWAWESNMDLSPGSATSSGWSLWTPLPGVGFTFVLGKTEITLSFFQVCPKDMNIYQMLRQSMGHVVAVAVIFIIHCASWGLILSERRGNDCCGRIFSGEFHSKYRLKPVGELDLWSELSESVEMGLSASDFWWGRSGRRRARKPC